MASMTSVSCVMRLLGVSGMTALSCPHYSPQKSYGMNVMALESIIEAGSWPECLGALVCRSWGILDGFGVISGPPSLAWREACQ